MGKPGDSSSPAAWGDSEGRGDEELTGDAERTGNDE